MLFNNKKFRVIFASAYYGAVLLAAVIIFIVGCTDMEKANATDMMSLVLGIFALAIPYLHFLSVRYRDGGVFKTVISIIAHALTYGCSVLLVLCANFGSGNGEQLYRTVCVSSLISVVITLTLYDLISYCVRSRKDENGETSGALPNVLYFAVFIAPFAAYLFAFLLLRYLNLTVTLMVAGALYIFGMTQTLGGTSLVGKILGAAGCLVFLLCSVIYGSTPSGNGLNYDNEADTFVFLPCLTAIAMIPFAVSLAKREISNSVYLGISRAGAFAVLVFLQWLIGFKWYIGLICFAVLVVLILILDIKFRPAALKERERKARRERLSSEKSSGGDSVGFGRDIANMLEGHMSGYDYAEVTVTGTPPNGRISAVVHYRHEIHANGNWYRNDIVRWIKNYVSSHPSQYSNFDINVSFSDDF